MASTVHKCLKSIQRERRRPRPNAKNKGHLPKVFGTFGVASIFIPLIINCYNYWMGGVDRCDQMIAYYNPDLRFMRNWLPLFLQMVQICCVNMWIVYKSNVKGLTKNHHPQFRLDLMMVLQARARELERTKCKKRKSPRLDDVDEPAAKKKQKKVHMCYRKFNVHLPSYVDRQKCFHKTGRKLRRVKGCWKKSDKRQRRCEMCSFYYHTKKESLRRSGREFTKKDLPHVATSKKGCSACKKALCADHLFEFHEHDEIPQM